MNMGELGLFSFLFFVFVFFFSVFAVVSASCFLVFVSSFTFSRYFLRFSE